MPTPQEKIEELTASLQEVVDNHNKAAQVVSNCKEQIMKLQGGIEALKSLADINTEITE
jgi:hypothetical protein